MAFDLPAQDAVTAIPEFARQAGIQIIAPAGQLNGIQTPAILGNLDVRDALRTLLQGTQLEIATDDGQVISLRRKGGGTVPSDPQASSVGPTGDSDRTVELQGSSADGAERSRDIHTLDEIFVTGTRLRNANNEALPIVVFDRARIDSLGVSNIADLLKYMPQQSFSSDEYAMQGGARVIQLRGLGLGTTLVLINGRRTVTSAVQNAQNFFDINTIPLAAVERVEVLSDSASAIYGADAVGGVVNIILKKYVPAPTLFLSYGTAEGGADETRQSISVGYNSDRIQLTAVLDAFKRTALYGEERERLNDQDFRRFGSVDRRVRTANPGNITSLTPDNLPGLPCTFAAVPSAGGADSPSISDFEPTACTRNMASNSQYITALPEAKRRAAGVFVDYNLNDSLTLFGESLLSKNQVIVSFGVPTFALTVPASNAYNPFGVDVLAEYALTGLGLQEADFNSRLLRNVAGIRSAGNVWDWEFSLLRTSENGGGDLLNIPDFARIMATLASPDPSQALNVFQEGPGGSEELLRSLVPDPRIASNYESSAKQAEAFVRGTIAQLPTGPVKLSIGGEIRSEAILFDNTLAAIRVDKERRTNSAYAEVRLPLVSPAQGVSIANQLSIGAAGRYDKYNDFGETFNEQYSIDWNPVSTLLVRSTYSTGFLAPSLYQLYSPESEWFANVTDRRRDNETLPVALDLGGNPDLRPEDSESWSTGIIWTPAWNAARIGFTYWSISQKNRVLTLHPGLILENESLFPDRVLRADPTPADTAAGWPGQILRIDTRAINYGELRTNGIDAMVTAGFETHVGRMSPSITATWTNSYQISDLPNTPAVERVGVANFNGTVPRLRAVANLLWERNPFSASIAARYRSAYDDVNTLNEVYGRTISAQTVFDVQAALTLDSAHSKLKGFTLRLGGTNILDAELPFSEVIGTAGYDPSQGDIRGRFLYVNLTKEF